MLSLSLDDKTEQEFAQLAQRSGKPTEQFLTDILLDYLEDIHDAALGDAAIDRLESGEDFTVPFSEAKRQLNGLVN